MKMVRMLIQVPTPLKAKLDGLLRKATRRAATSEACWSES